MICLPFAAPEQGGGGYGFLRLFEKYLNDHEIPWHRSLIKPADVLFVNAWHTSDWYVGAWKVLHRGKVVHRMDGWADMHNRVDAVEKDCRQRNVRAYADLVIYQSEFAKHCDPYKHDGKASVVIHNPVDLDVFKPEGGVFGSTPLPRVACVSWSDNPKKGAAAIYRIAEKNPGVHFVMLGRWPFTDLPNVHLEGIKDQDVLACYLRGCDALLTMSEHEACPNHVLEAMACGLPVLYLDSGATGEIVGENGTPLKEASAHMLFEDLHELSDGEIRREIRATTAERFAPEVIFPLYMKAMGQQ